MGVKISDLTSATSLTGSEELPIVQGGNTKKTTINDILALLSESRSANLTMNTGSLVGSGEKSNLLLEDFSGDKEEEKDEEELPIEEIPLEENIEKESGENDELR